MIKSLEIKNVLLNHFKKVSKVTIQRSGNIVISYNRVSSKDQMENGNSLDCSRKGWTSLLKNQT